MGLDDNDIDRLSNIDGVDKVIGSYEKDTYLKLNNEQYVIKVIGLMIILIKFISKMEDYLIIMMKLLLKKDDC